MNVTLVIPVPIVTDDGTDRLVLLELREKLEFVGAGLARVIVHVLLPGVWMVVGPQTKVALIAPAWRVMVAVLLPPDEDAVSVGVWVVLTACVPTANPTLAEPAKTVTWLGGVRVELLLDTVTGVPPAGAAALRVTVQLTVPPPTRLLGLHTSEAIPGCVT